MTDVPVPTPSAPKTYPARAILDLRIEFKDGRVLEIPKELDPSFELLRSGYLFIYYRPVITADAKEQLDLTFERRWYALDEISQVRETRIERRTDPADIRGFKLDNHKGLAKLPNAVKGEEYVKAPDVDIKK